MSTSDAVVEILVSGTLALFALALLIFGSVEIFYTDELGKLAIGIPVAGALAYQLGWLNNMGTHKIALKTYIRSQRKDCFGDKITNKAYRLIKAHILNTAGPGLLQRLRRHVSIQRITRGSAVNFSFLAVAIAVQQPFEYNMLLTTACLVIAIVSVVATRNRQRRYYLEMAAAAVDHGLWYYEDLPEDEGN